MHSFLSHSTGNQPSVLTPHALVNDLLAKPIGSICRRRLHRAQNPCKGRTCPAGRAVIGARLPLDRWRSRGLLTKPPNTSSRRAASGCLSRADRPITPRTDKCSSRTQVARGRGVLGPREPACPVGDVPGFVSTGPARDRESAAYSGDAGETPIGSICRRRFARARAEPPAKGRTRARGGTRRNRCPAPPGVVQGASNERKLTQLSAADHSARESMKDAAKCVN